MTFTNSSLVDYTKISPNRTKNRNHSIDTITIHCVVGQCTVEALGEVFASPSRQTSSNYGIGYDGKIGMYCEEKDRSWCSSSGENDHRAITIEVASDSYSPYKITEKAYAALIDLCADICKRNGIDELKWEGDKSLIGQVDKQNMTVHRWFSNKSCPGDYLYGLHGQIAQDVNARISVKENTTQSGSTTSDKTSVFQTGDIVKIIGDTYYDGNEVPAWITKMNWIVHSATSTRIVINKSEDGKYAIMSPFRASDIKLADSNSVSSDTTNTNAGTTTDEKVIWYFLYEKISNPFGVAGLMGNLYAESGLCPTNLQQYYETKLGYTDTTYTNAVDNGSYDNFAKDCAGYGIAQWTYWSRKQSLLNYAKKNNKSIGDLSMQLEFLWYELNENFASVVNALKDAQSVRYASDIVLTRFESPADQSETAKAKRASYGQEYYNKYTSQNSVNTTQPNAEFSVGDIVNFAGGTQYVSSNASVGVSIGASKAKITLVSPKSTHKYHCRAINDNGDCVHGVFGWVDEDTISPIETTWEPKIGDVVMFSGDTHYISANSSIGLSCKSGEATIVNIHQPNKSKHPYLLKYTISGKSTVHGWVDVNTFTKA